ncbi:hypothetical protein LguiA_005505 [Lonicera macranthoides]
MECQSFSLIYANGERSLDLICKDKEQADSWFLGLRAVISRCQRPISLGTCENQRVAQSCVNSPAGFMRRKQNLGLSEEARRYSQVNSLSGSPTLSYSERCFSDGLSCSSDSFYSESSLSTMQNPMDNFLPNSSYIDPNNLKKRTCASIKEDKNVLRDVLIWGEAIEGGCLGGGDNKVGYPNKKQYDALLPKLLESTTMLDVQKISLGGKHAALVTKQGEVFCWGEGKGGKLGHKVDMDITCPKIVDSLIGVYVKSVSCSEYQTCALSFSGELYTWGDNCSGPDLAGLHRNTRQWLPSRFSGILDGLSVSNVACGEWHTAIVSTLGKLFTLGDGTFGVLGHGNLENVYQPKEVESLNGLCVKSVACGPWHTAAIVDIMVDRFKSNDGPRGKLFTWGDGDKGKLGHANQERKLLPTCVAQVVDHDFVQVSCGRMLTVGLTNMGTVYTMGSAVHGQLGNPMATGKSIAVVQGKLKHEFVKEISSGSYHVAVLTSRGNVYTWGKGANGQLGVGDSEDRNTPNLVEVLRERQVESITCGPSSTAAICLHKSVSCIDQSACRGCSMAFGFTRKKHNCYNCGLLFCNVCSSKKAMNACLAPEKKRPFRVCEPCFNHLQRTQSSRLLNMENLTPRPLLTTQKKIHHEIFSESQMILPKNCCDEDSQLSERKIIKNQGENKQALDHVSSLSGMLPRWGQVHSPECFPKCHSGNTMTGNCASKTLEKDLSESDKILEIEVRKLRAQAESLEKLSETRKKKIQECQQKTAETWAFAKEEAAKCKAAKEVIKALTSRLQVMSEQIAATRDKKDQIGANPLQIESICTQTPAPKAVHPMFVITAPPEDVKADSMCNSPILFSNTLKAMRNRDMYSCDNRLAEETCVRTDNGQNGKMKAEWIEQYQPGVYITFTTLPSGQTGLKRVRFRMQGNVALAAAEAQTWYIQAVSLYKHSNVHQVTDFKHILRDFRANDGVYKFNRKRFTDKEAQSWWAENQLVVYQKYDIEGYNMSSN